MKRAGDLAFNVVVYLGFEVWAWTNAVRDAYHDRRNSGWPYQGGQRR